jgi:putative transposase
VIRTVRAPRTNAVAERFVRTVRAECTYRMLVLTRRHLERVLGRYVHHYNDERPHRGLQLETPTPNPRPISAPSCQRIRRRDALGGLIHEYWADAA